jgi:hypothetical protein
MFCILLYPILKEAGPLKKRARFKARLKRLQVLDQFKLFLLRERQFEEAIVVVNDISQSGESPVVIEPALLMCP